MNELDFTIEFNSEDLYKTNDPTTALKGALSAIERQVRQRRDKLQKTWEQPGNDPVTQEVMEVMLAENQPEED